MLVKIPRGTPIHDERAWFVRAGAADQFRVVGHKVVGGKKIDIAELKPVSTPWMTWEKTREAFERLSQGKDVELWC